MPDRTFLVGETVTLYARVSAPGTKRPVDPTSVVLTGMAKQSGDPVTLTSTTFGRVEEGQYALDVPTVGLAAGTYNYVVTVSGTDDGGNPKVVKVEDRFVLRLPIVSGA